MTTPLTPALVKICPKAPTGAEDAVQTLGGNLLWLVIVGFSLAIAASIGAILVGRSLHMHRVNVAGWIGLLVTVLAAVAMVVAPNILTGILGQGCVG